MDIQASLIWTKKGSADPPWILLSVTGRLDSLNFEFLEGKLQTIRSAGNSKIVLDLSAVPFINLSAARLISATAEAVNSDSGSFAWIGKGGHALRHLREFIPEERFPAYASKTDFLSSIGASS